MQITVYCPDRHFLYDGTTPDQTGVGGGLTVRIRIATALAKRGHRVRVICNCPRPRVHAGVEYLPLEGVDRITADVLVMHSSGGALDLSPLLSVKLETKVRIFLLSGLDVAKRIHELNPDAIYVCSNFIRTEMQRSIFAGHHIFVAHYGVNRWNWKGLWGPARDERRLIYSSHPSKGFDVSREVVRRLRSKDPRYSLHCYGGNRLWGGKDEVPPAEPGLFYGGLVDQRRLAKEYQRSGFLMQLQTRREPFGITVVEGMAAGCLVVASPVGSFTELIRNGENGFLVEGDPADPQTVERAAELIANAGHNTRLMRHIRRQAMATPFDWDTLAEAWESHISWLIDRNGAKSLVAGWARCVECRSASLVLADGYHCTECGYFGRSCAAG